MQIHNIVRTHPNKKKKIVGRGGRHAKTSGRGTKGQNARAGRKKRPELRDRIKKLPKLRGYRFNSIEDKPRVVNLSLIEKVFSTGDVVTPAVLYERGLVRSIHGRKPKVKVLSVGELSKKINFKECLVSAGARAKIEKAGGKIE